MVSRKDEGGGSKPVSLLDHVQVRERLPPRPRHSRKGYERRLNLLREGGVVARKLVSSTLLQRWITPQAAKPGAFFCVFPQFHAYLPTFGHRSEAHQQGLGQKPRKGML